MKKFKQIFIEITNKCNLNCPFCPNSTIKKQSMDLKMIKNIFSEIKNYTDIVALHIQGEPLLHPDLLDIIDECIKQNLKINLTTNGVLIDRLSYKNIDMSVFKKINFSLQAIINQGLDYNEYLNKIADFLINKEQGLPINLRLWNNKNNPVNIINNDNLKKYFNEIIKTNNIQNVRFSEENEFYWPTLEMLDNPNLTSCLGGKDQLGILVDGRVVLCCLDYLGLSSLGNIKEQSLDTILTSTLYKNVVKGFNDRKPYMMICKKCTYRNRFSK